MRSVTSLAAILASNSLVSAIPTPDGRGISLNLFKRAGAQFSTNVRSLMPGVEKWTFDIQVGSQTLPIVIDTGSADFWIQSTKMPPEQTGSNHPLYDPTPANLISGFTWQAGFDGATASTAKGIAYYDQVVIGGATVTRQVVGAATSLAVDAQTQDKRMSGIMGLSHQINQTNYPKETNPRPRSVMGNLMDQRGISVFTLDLRTDNTGTLDIGYIDPSKYTGSITYVKPDLRWTNWYVPIDAYSIGGVRQSDKPSGNDLIHPDSGAPFIKLHPNAVVNYYNKVQGSTNATGVWKFPCSGINDLPSLGLTFGGVSFTVPGPWMWQSVNGQSAAGRMCVGALQSGSTTDFAIAGDMFLRTVFAVFDMGFPDPRTGRVGFATKNLATNPV